MNHLLLRVYYFWQVLLIYPRHLKKQGASITDLRPFLLVYKGGEDYNDFTFRCMKERKRKEVV